MEKRIIYGGEGRPHFESNFKIFLKFVLLFIYKMTKAASSAAQRIFPSGFDGKKIIKE